MSDIVISAEGVAKRYMIRHQAEGKPRYKSLRETMAASMKNAIRSLSKAPGENGARRGQEEFWALREIGFEVRRGEVVGIVGHNGAGKSTLLKILSRITEPTKGRITIRGRLASLLEVGTGFHPELTGRENIFLNGSILGMSKQEIAAKFDEIIAFSGVERFLDTPVKRYSSGMYMRLAFSIAAHLEPEILVIDEVLAVGDAEFQKKCLGKMQDVASSGRTVLFVSHNMGAVEALCQRGILLKGGRIVLDGGTRQVIEAYTKSFREAPRVALSARQQDGGSRQGRLENVAILNSAGEQVNAIRSGDAVTLKFDYTIEHPIRRPRIIVGVYDLLSIPVLRFDSDFASPEPLAPHSKGSMTCSTGPWRLTPGELFVNLAFYGDGDLLAHYRSVFTLQVESGQLDGGRSFSRQEALFQIEQAWGMEGAE